MGRSMLALLLVFACLPARADGGGPWLRPLRGAWHWVGHHKLELAADLTMVAAAAADVETSYRSQSNPCGCVVETNGFLGPHPTRLNLWGLKLAFLAPLIVTNHYVNKTTLPPPGEPGLLHDTAVFVIPAVWDLANTLTARKNASLIGQPAPQP
jgi:hypothetical protein